MLHKESKMSQKWYPVYGVSYVEHRWPSVCVCCAGAADEYLVKTLAWSRTYGLGRTEFSGHQTAIPFCRKCWKKHWWQTREHQHCFGTRAVKFEESRYHFNIFFRNTEVGRSFKETNGILDACPNCGSPEYTWSMPYSRRRNTCKKCGHVW